MVDIDPESFTRHGGACICGPIYTYAGITEPGQYAPDCPVHGVPVFPWPCDRRDAHGRHPIHPPGVVMGHPGRKCGDECPGVPAHPSTMAGGSYRD